MNPAVDLMSPAQWPDRWTEYVTRNEAARYEYDRRRKPAFFFKAESHTEKHLRTFYAWSFRNTPIRRNTRHSDTHPRLAEVTSNE